VKPEIREPQPHTNRNKPCAMCQARADIMRGRSSTHHRPESHWRRVRGRSAMGTPRRTVPSLSKREGSLRGVLAASIGESGGGGSGHEEQKTKGDCRRAEGSTRRKVRQKDGSKVRTSRVGKHVLLHPAPDLHCASLEPRAGWSLLSSAPLRCNWLTFSEASHRSPA
jgi:hypothetical protein